MYIEKRVQFYDPGGPSVLLMGNLVDYDGSGWHSGSPRYRELLKTHRREVKHDFEWVFKKVLKELTDYPAEFIKLYLRKIHYFFNNYEIPSNNNFYLYQRFSYILKNPLSNFSLIASLAILGLIATLQEYRKQILLYLFLLAMSGSVIVFYNVSRFRMPAIPFYLLFSSAGVYALCNFIFAKQYFRFLLAVGLIVGLLFYLRIPDIKKIRGNDYGMLGGIYLKKGQHDKAISEYKEALGINPDFVEVHYNLASLLDKQGRSEEAIVHYLQALRIQPDLAEAHYNLASLLNKQGRTEEAIEHYLQALRIQPDLAEAHYNLASLLNKQGRTEEAIAHYLQVLRIKPEYDQAHNNLAAALFLKGNIEGAIAHFRKALRINPDNINAKNNLKKVLIMQQKND